MGDGTVKKRFYIFSQSLFVFVLCIVHHLSYPASRDLRLAARVIPLARDGAVALSCYAGWRLAAPTPFFSLCTERLKGMFISFFPGEERNEPKKEATDQ